MTIDEMKTILTGDENDSLMFAEAVNMLNDLLKELLWYREQDLIKREDAINKIIEIANHYKEKSEYLMEYSVLGCVNALGIISKAEPTKE